MGFSCFHLFILSLGLTTVYSLTCYKCDSAESFPCNYGLMSFAMSSVDCQNDPAAGGGSFLTSWVPKQCVKITANDKDGNALVARGCMPYLGEACNVIVKTFSFFSSIADGVHDINCYPCNGDKCNGSTKLPVINFSYCAMLAVIVFLF